ncbi:hypothetical protein HYS00_00615 [Candidatus Microgenomates bacterium]|nr:hypothetical protein [Candidatus Microgenomates bacterium]
MKRFLRRSARVGAILWLALALSGVLIYLYQTYSVKNVVVISNDGNQSHLVGLSELYGANLLILNEKQLEKDLMGKNPALNSIAVNRVYPATLQLRVSLRKPIVALQASDEGVFILDHEGVILLRLQKYTGPLPILKYYQTFPYKQYQVGDKIDYKDVMTALYFTDALSGFGYPAKRIDIDGLYMIRLLVIDNKTFFATSEKDREIQLYQLKELLRQFKLQGKDFKTIDLRFDKPVITIK